MTEFSFLGEPLVFFIGHEILISHLRPDVLTINCGSQGKVTLTNLLTDFCVP